MRKSENGKLTQIICNSCGRELKVEKEIIREGYFTADVRFGYFSRKDGMRHTFDLCEDCYDRWIGRFVIPVEEVPETELLQTEQQMLRRQDCEEECQTFAYWEQEE